jgi:hypothetical protein
VEQTFRDSDQISEEKHFTKKPKSIDLELDYEKKKSNNYQNNFIGKSNNQNDNSSSKSGYEKCCLILC